MITITRKKITGSNIGALFVLLASLIAQPQAFAQEFAKGELIPAFSVSLKQGQFTWIPEASPAGPVVIIVSLFEQTLYVYRNGIRIGRSTISSGKPGHRTPTGVFTILQKSVKHTSTIFKGASMPFMERLTWAGVAMHAGDLPGYPASHGCVRLPLDFARELYEITDKATTVIVTNQKSEFSKVAVIGLLLEDKHTGEHPSDGFFWQPEKSPDGPVSIIFSSISRLVVVYRNGVEIGNAPVKGFEGFKGAYVYLALTGIDKEGRHDWLSTTSIGGVAPDLKEQVAKARVDAKFLAAVRSIIVTGTTLILTDLPIGASTRTTSGFSILTTDASPE